MNEIGLTCVCGNRYYSPRGRFHLCCKCGHVWDLRPDLPNDEDAVNKLVQLSETYERMVKTAEIAETGKSND